jgi:AmiR/NasT family two-component response regulator
MFRATAHQIHGPLAVPRPAEATMSKAFEERVPDQPSLARDQVASDGELRTTPGEQTVTNGDVAAGESVTQRPPRPDRRRTSRSRDAASAVHQPLGVERLHAVESRSGARRVRVLVADEGPERLEALTTVVAALGHEVVTGVAEHPDVALIGLDVSSDHALKLIDDLVHDAACPVIALLPAQDAAYVREAAKRGIFAYVVEAGPEELQSAIDITLRRFTEYHDLQGAFGRRAVIEQAKGMLMARHRISSDDAFDLLRNHSQHGGGRLSDIAASVVGTNSLLPPGAGSESI